MFYKFNSICSINHILSNNKKKIALITHFKCLHIFKDIFNNPFCNLHKSSPQPSPFFSNIMVWWNRTSLNNYWKYKGIKSQIGKFGNSWTNEKKTTYEAENTTIFFGQFINSSNSCIKNQNYNHYHKLLQNIFFILNKHFLEKIPVTCNCCLFVS